MNDNFDTLIETRDKKTQTSRNTLEFVRFWFAKFFVLSLWLVVIGCLVAGLGIGKDFGKADYQGGGYALLGGLIGLVIGVIIAIMVGGVTATFLSIAENIQKIAQKVDTTCSATTPQKIMPPQEQPKQ